VWHCSFALLIQLYLAAADEGPKVLAAEITHVHHATKQTVVLKLQSVTIQPISKKK